MSLRPLSDRLVVRPIQTERIGRIILPDTAKKQLEQKRGTVLAVGPGRWCPTAECRIPVQLKPGDVIEYGWDGHKIRENGEDLMIVHEAEVLCVIGELERPHGDADPDTCKHKSIDCNLAMAFIEDTNRWQADIRITCADCGTPFRFIGLPAGLDMNGAAVSVDGQEGRFSVAPKGQVVTPLESTECSGFTVRKVK